jgi:hypothetical protein
VTPIFLARELVFLAAARRRTGASNGVVRPLVEEARAIATARGLEIVPVDLAHYELAT